MNSDTQGFTPAYLRLFQNGALAERARRARQLLENCTLCPRRSASSKKVRTTAPRPHLSERTPDLFFCG
ncbi:hypothetical protein GFER_00850 [Geoalkalibacter ferrihydriticus DSM 17813]|uniref:Uncharacterized protein n=1 Tax=Geoalkalibacter ferrihydriticus DSM 17813 TaxID=1121915 RepID=A0A0C2HJU1_9BACT|nr:hypothetical protein GFER_00850 [Geoalkalibacter ferrihydriticus DSM 17813]